MNTTINIKAIGVKFGTVGWLKQQLESGELILEESNDYYIPIWSNCYIPVPIKTHGLIIRDKSGKNSALLAYRTLDGDYKYNISAPLSADEFAHWPMALTDAAKDALRDICSAWIDNQTEDTMIDSITVTIKRA